MLAPTLIVGLGGIGSKITAKLAAMISDEKRERINFVVFDTDINELGKIKRENPFISTVQTSTNMTVGDYLHLDKHTRETSFPVNPNLYRKTLSEGAGQVRAISHLAFVTAMKRGYLGELDNAIYDLYKLESVPTTQVLRVIIVSTLAGGTGSGLILPVSMYIKQFLKTKIQIPGSITRGFFILPEILYSSVTAEPMRNAFKANAYAVLRELNAFILKADGNLPDRYKNKVHLEFPKIGTDEFEEYDVLPMDFSFMFDAQNIEGKKLNSTEQYLDHAATCIYAQSIGPMNTRSNSSEDNVIRTLVSGQSRNRYAGAGASELVYPSKHILRYIALKWAGQSVSNHWMQFDNDYYKQSKENNRDRLKGINVPEIDQAAQYIQSVDNTADKGNAFSMFVRNLSYKFDKDGFTQVSCKWNAYLDELEKFVKQRVAASGQSELDSSRDTAQSTVEAITSEGDKPDMEKFKKAYGFLVSYKELVSQRIGNVGRNISYSLFKSNEEDDPTETKLPTQIETYMVDDGKKFMHPNAARYFLYQALQTIEKKLKELNKKKENAEKAFKSFDTLFDDSETEGKEESIGDFLRKIEDAGFWAHITKKNEGKIKEYIEQYESLLDNIADYRITAPYTDVLTAAQKYISGLCDSFAKFYKSFESNVKEIERQIKTMEEKYSLKKGNAIRYVCTSKKCLDKFYEKMEFAGSAMQLPGELCERIYAQVRYHSVSPDIKTGTFFQDIFDKEILGHFERAIMETYSTDIKMDIIRALEVEAEYEENIQDRGRIIEYVKKVIGDTKKLSDPFINRPVGEETVAIPACAYNKKLVLVDNPEREALVNSELHSFGGVACDDDEIESERVLFYSAIYGLFPYDLLKFSPPKKSLTVTLEAGEYNKAYFDMINRIEHNPLKTPVITPHLHKHWHLISEMPDLSEDIQRGQEMRIYKALILGILYDRIRYERAGDKYKYSLWLKDSIREIELETSNGTPCDTFYEVVDALTINPGTVNKILKAVDLDLDTARKNNIIKFEESILYNGIKNLSLRELSHDKRQMSIFGIAAAYKATMPPDEFILEQGLMLLETILETLYDQIQILCPENERDNTYVALIESQLDLFTGNFDLYKNNYPSVIDNYLRMLLQIVITVLNRKGFSEAADKVDKLSKRHFSDDTQPVHKKEAEKKEA